MATGSKPCLGWRRVLEQVQMRVVADSVGEQGRDPGARIVDFGPTIALLLDPFYP